ncbi:MAG: hypothetical protein HFF00_06765 [Ruminiclostridium sp.]|jgi:hypothetical protein|nr:hypothetical protein [Ruminiclostridium sp.]
MFKRKVAVIMAILTLMSVTSAYAAPQSMAGMSPQVAKNYRNAPEEVQDLIEHNSNLQEAAQLAYMDLEKAPANLKEEIIAAREQIIFNELSWSADGGYIKNADGTIEVMPIFSDLFPGWDLPGASDLNSSESISPYGIEDLETTKIKNYSIPRYRESVQAPVMTNLLSHSKKPNNTQS